MTPWENNPNVWKNSSSFFAWLRSNLRKSLWSRSPIKHEFIHANRTKIANPNPKRSATVYGAKCAICHKDYKIDQIEVDHIKGEHKLTCIEDIQSFIESIVIVDASDLQLLCKPCHKIKTHAERTGMSFEEAEHDKEVIEKCKLPTASQIELLKFAGLPYNNSKVRRKSMEILVKKSKYLLQ